MGNFGLGEQGEQKVKAGPLIDSGRLFFATSVIILSFSFMVDTRSWWCDP